jgi:hypothetical protein
MEFAEPLVANAKKISVKVTYQNTGKEPASGLVSAESGGPVDLPAGKVDWQNLSIPQNTTCDDLAPKRGSTVSYPSSTFAQFQQFGVIVKNKTTGQDATDRFANAVLNEQATLYINGCFAYFASGEPHRSAFCFYLFPDSDVSQSKWDFRFCATGNWAD